MSKAQFHLTLVPVDRTIVVVCFILFLISIALIASASVQEAMLKTGDSLFFVKRQLVYIVLAIVWGLFISTIPSQTWFTISFPLIGITLFFLLLVLLFGREINSAKRWIEFGPVNFQPAEMLKVVWILYFSQYVSRKLERLRSSFFSAFWGFLQVAIPGFFLLQQPDFGSLVVIATITFGIFFITGIGLLKYISFVIAAGLLGWLFVILQPYRVARIMSFLDPFADVYGDGYQLALSLMGFARGGAFGEGIGNSMIKLSFLPEAHTDFVTAILAEECGFVGVCVVLFLEMILVYKALHLSFLILRQRSQFQGYVAFGIGVFFCLQTLINIGVASGALPTKGLTLPLVSYGGSSLLMCAWALGILLRIDFEWRHHKLGELCYS